MADMDRYFRTDHLQPDLKKRAAKGAGAIVFSNAFSFLIQIAATVVLARLLTPDDFGLISMITTFSLLLQNFGLNGFTEAIIQREEVDHGMISTLFWLNAAVSLCLTVLFMALSPVFAWFYKDPRLKTVTLVVAFSIISSGLGTMHSALLKRGMQFIATSAISSSSKVISVIITIILAWMGWGYWALAINTISLPLISALGAWFFCSWRPGSPIKSADVRSMSRFALNVYGNFSLNYASRNIDNLLVGKSFGSQSLGFYKKAYDLFALPVNQLTAPLTDVAVAALSRLRGDTEKFRRTYLKTLSFMTFIGMAISMLFTLTAKDMILLILGPRWNTSGEIFTFFGPGIGVMLIYYTNGWLHLSLGRADRWFRWGFVELFVTATFFVLGLSFGPSGVAAAWTVSFYLLTGVGLWYAGRPIQLKPGAILSVVWRYFIAGIIAGTTSWEILYTIETISQRYTTLPVFFRIMISTSLSMSFYLAGIAVLHGSIKPFSELYALVKEMIPSRFTKKMQEGNSSDAQKLPTVYKQ